MKSKSAYMVCRPRVHYQRHNFFSCCRAYFVHVWMLINDDIYDFHKLPRLFCSHFYAFFLGMFYDEKSTFLLIFVPCVLSTNRKVYLSSLLNALADFGLKHIYTTEHKKKDLHTFCKLFVLISLSFSQYNFPKLFLHSYANIFFFL